MGVNSDSKLVRSMEAALRVKRIWTDTDKHFMLRNVRKVSRSLNKPINRGLDKPTRTGYNGSHKQSGANKIPAKPKGRIDNDIEAA